MSGEDTSGRPAGPGVRTPAGLRWSCRGCAHCCSTGLDLGPVEPSVIADLEASDIAGLWAPAAEGSWYERRVGPDNSEQFFLTQRGGRCVMLRDDNLCAVHALLGSDRKPGFCREFPYHVVHEPRGVVAVVRPSCGGFFASFRDGDDVGGQVGGAELEAVLALPRVHPRRVFAPAQVEILPGKAVGLEDWLSLEDAAIAGLEARPALSPESGVARIRDLLTSSIRFEPVPVRVEQAHAAARALFLALGRVMDQVLSQTGTEGSQRAERRATAEESRAALAKAAARFEAGPLPPLDADATAWCDLLLRSHLLAKQWQAWGSVHAGLGEWLLGLVFARSLAAAQHPPGHPDPLTAAEISEPLGLWLRFSANAMIAALLRQARVALTDLFLHAR